MSAAPNVGPGGEQKPKLGPGGEQKPATTGTLSMGTAGGLFGFLVLIPVFLMIAFHVGAGYLSYQKYGSGIYAFLDFLFPYFYYPYYAFFLSGCPITQQPMMGGMMRMLKGKRK